MKISDVKLSVIQDSRGQDTLEARMIGDGFDVKASVPSGKSKGEHEVVSIDPALAVAKFGELRSEIISQSFGNQRAFDDFLIQKDATEKKDALGGNVMLALSLSFARAQSVLGGGELYEYIRELVGTRGADKFPRPIFNVINGGAHVAVPQEWKDDSGRELKLDFQEFQIIPKTDDFGLGLSVGQRCYEKLKMFLVDTFGASRVLVGDEAGFCAPFTNNEEALGVLQEVISTYQHPMHIGLDTAATQFYKNGAYILSGVSFSPQELERRYRELIDAYGVVSIEDPFFEEDFDSFEALTSDVAKKDVLVITDDLTTTNPKWLAKAIKEKAGNTILIKPNQIGTLSETLDVVSLAHQNGWKTVVSHRSGETEDDFIADLAVGVGAWGLKSGAPATPWRMNKYERVLTIWQQNLSQ